MGEVYTLAVLNLKMSCDRYPPRGNPYNKELKRRFSTHKNPTLQSLFDTKYKQSYRIIKRIGDKSFYMQDPTIKVKRVSVQHLQFIYPAEYYVTALPQIEMFGRTAIFIKHPSLMPDLYKDLSEYRHTAVDKHTLSTKPTRDVATDCPQPTPHNYKP